MAQRFYNNLEGRLRVDVGAADEQIDFDIVTGVWPYPLNDGDWFHLTLAKPMTGRFEIVRVTGTPLRTRLLVVRAQEATAALTWTRSETILSARLTAGTLAALAQAAGLTNGNGATWENPEGAGPDWEG